MGAVLGAVGVLSGCASQPDTPAPAVRQAAGAEQVGFGFGVASGDVTPRAAQIWTRSDRPQRVVAEVRDDGGFTDTCSADSAGATWTAAQTSSADRDLTVHFPVTGLTPGTDYQYRFCTESGWVSEVGAFRTAPAPDADVPVQFAFTGDATAEAEQGATTPYFNGFDVFRRIAESAPDFWVFGGDVIYSDSVVGKRDKPTALTREEKWAKYHQNLAQDQLREARAATSVYSHWDDHEWDNGFFRTADNDKVWRAGRDAFLDYMPARHSDGDGLYAVYRWGRNLDLFVLDETSFRTEPVDEIPAASNPCWNPKTNRIDRIPLAPPEIREELAATLKEPSLLWPVPEACRRALNEPDRTILGTRQFESLRKDLADSTATFRVIVSTGPMQQVYVAPYGRFEGYPAERRRLLDVLDRTPNTVSLATDIHATLINTVGDRAHEVAVGPAAAGTRSFIWDRYFPKAPRPATEMIATDLFLTPVQDGGLGLTCAQMDTYSYATVEVDSTQLKVVPRDKNGQPLRSTGGGPCEPLVVAAQ